MMNAFDLHEIEELQQTEVKEQWSIDSLETANWALRKINALNKKMADTVRLAKEEHDRINEWELKETESDQQSITFFEEKLGQYLVELRKDDPKARIKTPYGTVGTRKQAEKIEYSASTIDELKEKGMMDFIRIKEEVNKTELKKHLTITSDYRVVTADGEILKSATVIPAYEKTIVKAAD